MKNYILLLAIALTGCGSFTSKAPEPKVLEIKNGEQELIVDKFVQPMGRNEVIAAVKQCETAGLRAVPMYAKRKINGYSVETLVEVTCGPRYQF